MNEYQYALGSIAVLQELFPDPSFANANLNFYSYQDVIRHYTISSLKADGIGFASVSVGTLGDQYVVTIEGDQPETYATFGQRHAGIFDAGHAQKALMGAALLKELNVWNPMEGYHVNRNPQDGTSKWTVFPPLGLNVIGQRSIVLMHYPPWACVQAATFDNSMTMQRWSRLLEKVGIDPADVPKHKTIVDVNPIAAPGSGESEYPNDYFPVMMASGFFDGPPSRDYIKSMLELYLNPPGTEQNQYTLPLLICGSPLYDPQAPAWFRVAYTDILPQENQIPQVNVLQTGTFRIRPDSPKETPYMICNHMIAAGVTGRCTQDAAQIPDIRQYEAQDLVAASFLKLYQDNPNQSPAEVKAQACQRWYGNPAGTGAPNPPAEGDRLIICALAQMDLFFVGTPYPHPKYSFEVASERCRTLANPLDDPCAAAVAPPPRQQA